MKNTLARIRKIRRANQGLPVKVSAAENSLQELRSELSALTKKHDEIRTAAYTRSRELKIWEARHEEARELFLKCKDEDLVITLEAMMETAADYVNVLTAQTARYDSETVEIGELITGLQKAILKVEQLRQKSMLRDKFQELSGSMDAFSYEADIKAITDQQKRRIKEITYTSEALVELNQPAFPSVLKSKEII